MYSQLKTTAAEAESDRQPPRPSGRSKITPTTPCVATRTRIRPSSSQENFKQQDLNTKISPPQQCSISPCRQVQRKNASLRSPEYGGATLRFPTVRPVAESLTTKADNPKQLLTVPSPSRPHLPSLRDLLFPLSQVHFPLHQPMASSLAKHSGKCSGILRERARRCRVV